MRQRLNFYTAAPDAYQAVAALENYVRNSGIEKRHIHLIKLRASIINGCSYCVDMHSKEALSGGLPQQWINLISAWQESPIYDDKERALLAWVDAVTNLAQTGAPDDAFQALKAHFSEEEMTKLTVAIGVINIWNRLCVGFRSQHPIDEPAQAA
ncbi:carboxymuconolactone decarboxylase family protein [Candidatus Phyllobacterium onerii]|uniref:carboxymuconolactone decarboxylase family protein n=1 Tax=Candidatus Phyllobacterium onerii TaxID=3020828 RepID=UPI00232DB6B5|nr:carboxymuconolactone decarboxylase family protein [Phyllobacterium sp. IY22]